MDFKLKDKSDIEGTCWIEFNISGTAKKYDYWAETSKYLDEFEYNLFTDIFERHAENFDYYGATKLDVVKQNSIISEIYRSFRIS